VSFHRLVPALFLVRLSSSLLCGLRLRTRIHRVIWVELRLGDQLVDAGEFRLANDSDGRLRKAITQVTDESVSVLGSDAHHAETEIKFVLAAFFDKAV